MSRITLTHQLIKLIHSKQVINVFINGYPGTGKSTLLEHLAQDLPNLLAETVIIGPCKLSTFNPQELEKYIVNDLHEQCFFSLHPREANSLVQTWKHVSEAASIPDRTTFVVLVDLEQSAFYRTSELAVLFSQARALESDHPASFHLVHIFAGFWDQAALFSYYEATKTSFPYTVGNNYSYLHGLTTEETTEILLERGIRSNQCSVYARHLTELTYGHPGIILEVLDHLPRAQLSVSSIFETITKLTKDGIWAQRLLSTWKQLPNNSKDILRQLVQQKHPAAPIVLTGCMEQLHLAGIVEQKIFSDKSVLQFLSWYASLVVYQHAAELGIDLQSRHMEIWQEFIPSNSSICLEAYQIIHETENQVRNFVVNHLWQNFDGDIHPLEGRVIRRNDFSQEDEDALQRADGWKNRNLERNILSAQLNPTIAYISTRDLMGLLNEIGNEEGLDKWKQIATKMNELVAMRDTVMHNQIIDENDLLRLYSLQVELNLLMQ